MSKANKVPLVVAILGLTILTAVLFVTTQVVFWDQPDVQNLFSIIWTIALVVLIYWFLWRGRTTGDASNRLNLYAVIRFMFELIAVLTLLFTAIMASVVLTSPGSSIQMIAMLVITGMLSLLLLIIPRALRLLNRQDELVKPDRN